MFPWLSEPRLVRAQRELGGRRGGCCGGRFGCHQGAGARGRGPGGALPAPAGRPPPLRDHLPFGTDCRLFRSQRPVCTWLGWRGAAGLSFVPVSSTPPPPTPQRWFCRAPRVSAPRVSPREGPFRRHDGEGPPFTGGGPPGRTEGFPGAIFGAFSCRLQAGRESSSPDVGGCRSLLFGVMENH